jgi:hypothetical protein
VRVESFATKAHAAKSAQAIDVAARSLQIFARRFGPYGRERFVVAEGPLRGGAGGMEYSGMTAIASALYGDLQKQLGAMTGMAGMLGGGAGEGALGGLLGDLEAEAYGTSSTSPGTSAPAASISKVQDDPLDGLGALGGLGMAAIC